MQPRPSPISHDPQPTNAIALTPPAIFPATLTLASVALRVGRALADADRLPPNQGAALLRTIAPEIRRLAAETEGLASRLDPIGEVEIVVTCRHCGHEQPTPIDWSLPCPSCGGDR